MLAVLAGSSSFGQTDSVFIINKGLPLTVSTGGSIFIKNGRYIQDDSENIEKLNLLGQMQADSGIISNNDNKNRMFLLPAVGTNYGKVTILSGAISGSGLPPRFGHLFLNLSDSLHLETSISVIDTLNLFQGILNLNGKNLNLSYPSGTPQYQAELIGETNTSFVGDKAGLGGITIKYADPFNLRAGSPSTTNSRFGGIGAKVATTNYATDITLSRYYEKQVPNNSFERYYLIEPGSAIANPEITINYLQNEKPSGSTPSKYRIFRTPSNLNSNYTPVISVVDDGAGTMFTKKAEITNIAQRYVIGDCPTEPVVTLNNKYSTCTNQAPLKLDAKEASHAANFTYQWYKNGIADVNSGQTNLYNILTTDNYAVLVTNPTTGCFNYHEFQVFVNPSPSNINFTPQTTLCEDRTLTFTNTTTNLSLGNYKNSFWDFDTVNNGTLVQTKANLDNGSTQYTNPGNYAVRLIMETDSSCKDTVVKAITVYDNPVAGITATTFERCANETFEFQNASTISGATSINTSYWYVNGIDLQTKSNPSHLATVQYNRIAPPGPANRTDVLMLVVKSNTNCLDTLLRNIQVRPLPSAITSLVIVPARSPIKFCIDSVIGFQATSVNNTTTYNWDFGESATNSSNSAKRSNQNPTGITYSNAGTFTPKLHVESNLGCKDSFAITGSPITVHPLPTPTFSLDSGDVCFGTALNLVNAKTINTAYNWDFGDATTSNNQGSSVSKSYSTVGTFNIKLSATSQFGCKNDSTKSVRIKPMPVVAFTTANKCEDSTVTFNTTVTTSPIGNTLVSPTYHWDFGTTNANALNTAQRSVQSPQISYTQHSDTSTYSPAIFVVAENCKSIVATNPITIHPNPVAAFTGGNNCNGGQIGFTNISTIDNPSTNSYNWNMGDGNTSLTHAGSFNYTYASASSSNYTVTLKATSNKGCIDDSSVVVKNYALPFASFEDSLASQCLDSTSKFINLSTMSDGSNLTYKWKYDDGDSSIVKDPNYVYKADGLFNVKLTVAPADITNPCRSDTTIAVVIYPLPSTSFTFTDNCVDDSIRLTNNTIISSGTLTYKWHFSGGTPDTVISASSFKHSYSTPDTNDIILKATSDKGCPISDTNAVRFYSFVDADFDSAKASVCIFDTSVFDNSSILKTKETWLYNWTFDNGATSTEKNPLNYYAATTPGFGIDSAYNVKLSITPTDITNVCRDSITKVVYIHPLPDSSFNITLDTFCLGIKTSFIKNTAQNLHTYHWDLGDGTKDSSTTFTQHTYQNSGTFRPELTSISEYNCVSTNTQNVVVLPVPQPNFIIQRDTVCEKDTVVLIDASDTLATTYVWNYGDGTPNDSLRQRGDTIRRLYTKANTYTISLTGIKGTCFSRLSKKVKIEPDPVVQFSMQRDNSNGKKVDFTNTSFLPNGSNGTLSFIWTYGDATTDSTKLNFFSHTYSTNNKFGVKLKATSNFGCFNEKIDTIETVNTPTSSFTLSTTSVCKGDSFSFTNNSTNAQTFFWNFGDGSTSTDSLPKHTYTQSGKFQVQLIAKDSNNYSDTSSQLVTINAIPIVQYSSNTNICAGDQAVFTNNSFVQSTDSLIYKWTFGDGDTSIEQSPIHRFDTGASYQTRLIVSTESGCTDTLSKTVNIYPGPIAKFDSAFARSCAGSLSTLTNQTIIATGETISGYLWRFQNVVNQPTSTNSSVTYASAGIYNVELVATSTRGCKDSITVPIIIDSIPILNFGGTQNTCGTSLTLDAKNTGATYLWSTNATARTITANTSGTYKVTVTLPGTQACKKVDSVVVNLNTPVNPDLGVDFSSCGDTILDAKNPGSTYSWVWSSGSSSSRMINVSTTDTFRVTVTDQNGCLGLDTVIATVTTPPAVNVGADINVCAGTAVTLDAGNLGKTFNWSNGGSTQTLSNPTKGFYIVTVTDPTTLCSTNDSINISYKPAPAFNLGTDKKICGTQGTLLNAGSITNGSYLWSDNSTLQTLTANQTGTYWAKITDNGNGCSTTDTIKVTINTLPTLSLNSTFNACAGSSIALQAVSSNATNYSFLWNDNSTDSTLNPTSTGLYSVTVTDTATTCLSIASSNVTLNQAPVFNLGNDTNLCGGKSLLLSVGSSNYSTTWSTSSNSPAISVKAAGTYSVVSTYNGCSTKDTITITTSTPPIVNLGNSSSICSSDTLELDAGNAGGTFKWSDNSTLQVLKVTGSGFYAVTVTDVNGCIGNANANVQAYTSPTLNLGNDDTVCQSSTVILDAKNPGASFSWSNNSTAQVIQVSAANTYTVTVTDQNNCKAIDSIKISYISKPIVNLGGNISLCSGLKDTLDAGNPGLNFKWSTGQTSQTLEVINAGTYRVTVSDGGCFASDQIVASIRSIPNVNLGIDKIGCAGDSITLSSLNNYPSGTLYNWSNSTSNRTTKAGVTGKYTLKVTDANNCSNEDSVNIAIKAVPIITLPPSITACGSTTLDAGNPGAKFAWNNNAISQTINARQTGTYIVSVSISTCVTKDTSIVTINALPVVNLGSDVSACANNAPVLDAGHVGKTYLWKGGTTAQTFTPTSSDTIWVSVTDNLTCTGRDTVVVKFDAGVTVNLGSDLDSCHYQDVILDAQNAGSRFLWSNGSRTQTVSIGQSGAYSVTVTDAKNCKSNDAINVTLNAIPVVNLGNDRDVCDSVNLDAKNPGLSYLWNDNSTKQKLLAETAGTYWAHVTSAKSCVGRDTVTLGIKPTPNLNLGADTNICSGSTLTLNAKNTGNTVLWSNNTSNQTISVATLGKYWVKVTNSLGCSKSDTINVNLGVSPTIDLGNDTGFCINQELPLDAGNKGGSYIWGGPNNYVDSTQISIVSAAGKYYVQVTTSGGCIGSDTINFTPKTDTVYAYFLSTSKVEMADTVQFVDLSYPDITSWNYDFGDQNSSNLQDPEHRYLIEGKFNVKLTVSNGSCQDSRTKEIEVSKRLKQDAFDPSNPEESLETTEFVRANLYPNPNHGSFRLLLELSQEDNVALYFFDMRGTILHQEFITGVDSYVNDFHFSDLAPGMYFMQANLGRERKVFRVVISR